MTRHSVKTGIKLNPRLGCNIHPPGFQVESFKDLNGILSIPGSYAKSQHLPESVIPSLQVIEFSYVYIIYLCFYHIRLDLE